ncbi:MAG: hypothetical protein WBD37_05135, partial [Anderseniella sp.]
MKPLVLFSGLALASAGGLLALTYQGWRDEPSALTSLSNSTQAVNIEKGEAVSTPPATQPAAPSSTPPAGTSETASSATNQVETQPAQQGETQPTQQGENEPASFDMVRVDEDGSAVLAGRAAPGSRVEVLVDGVVAGETLASERGEWVFVPEASLQKGAR